MRLRAIFLPAVVGIGVIAASAGGTLGAAAAPTYAPAPRTAKAVWKVDPGSTYRVMREIGPHSPNRTDLSGDVAGADLGSMFTFNGKTYMAFGDSYGGPGVPLGQNFFQNGIPSDWRSNTMAISSDANPSDGLTIDSMITDRPGHAEELLSSQKIYGTEWTVIPTNGIAVGSRMYLHYMSVVGFPATTPGIWSTNYAGIAYSDDGGQTWVKDMSVTWPAASNFEQVAFVQSGSTVYMYGIPSGRAGGVKLARVASGSLLDPTAYQYWTGGSWSANISAAATIVPPSAGELSVRYNSYYHKWLMLYTYNFVDIGLRTASAPTGPWSSPQIVTTIDAYPVLYAPFITPSWNSGPDIWFNLSQGGGSNYDVSLMHTQLTAVGAPPAPSTPTAAPGAKQRTAQVSWQAPATSGSSPITGYEVTAYYSKSSSYEEKFSLSPTTFTFTATTETITGLASGTAYTFKVAAINGSGPGPVSAASTAVTPK
jgi:hypothetical protein